MLRTNDQIISGRPRKAESHLDFCLDRGSLSDLWQRVTDRAVMVMQDPVGPAKFFRGCTKRLQQSLLFDHGAVRRHLLR